MCLTSNLQSPQESAKGAAFLTQDCRDAFRPLSRAHRERRPCLRQAGRYQGSHSVASSSGWRGAFADCVR